MDLFYLKKDQKSTLTPKFGVRVKKKTAEKLLFSK
jgi:hypothetical protein